MCYAPLAELIVQVGIPESTGTMARVNRVLRHRGRGIEILCSLAVPVFADNDIVILCARLEALVDLSAKRAFGKKVSRFLSDVASCHVLPAVVHAGTPLLMEAVEDGYIVASCGGNGGLDVFHSLVVVNAGLQHWCYHSLRVHEIIVRVNQK